MTQEEKAKAYDEALERAKKIHSEIVNNELIGFPGQIEDIFPELRESEDERIRRVLVDMVKRETGFTGFPSQGQVLAYLEKQKEQKVDTDKLCKDIYQSGYNDGYQHGKEDTQKEQKPVARENNFVSNHAEWSEEDLRHRCWILECLADGERKMPKYAEDFRAAYKWFKSLRPSWKPSEEQMEALNKVRTLNPGLDALYQQLKNM